MSLKVYFLIANRVYIVDGLRSALGLAIENHWVYACVFYHRLPEPTPYLKELIEGIREMEGDVFCVVDTMDEESAKFNVDSVGLTPLTLEELSARLKQAHLVIPYGTPAFKGVLPQVCL